MRDRFGRLRSACFLACAQLLASAALPAAKPPLPPGAHATWPSVGEARISDDGRYAAYALLAGSTPTKLVLVSTDARRKLELPATISFRFACGPHGACSSLVFQEADGKLSLVALADASVEALGSIDSYELPQKNERWLAYRLKGADQDLKVRDLSTGKESRYPGVDDFLFDEDGRSLLIKNQAALSLIDLGSGGVKTIWEGRGAGKALFDRSGRRLAFIVEGQGAGQTGRSFWHYSAGAERASLLADDRAPGLAAGLKLNDIREFSADGRSLLIDLKPIEPSLERREDAVDVDVWSYRDDRLQSQQLADLAAGRASRTHAALLDIDGRSVARIEGTHETLRDRAFNASAGELALLDRRVGSPDRSEYHWNANAELTTELVFLRDGRRIAMPDGDVSAEGRPQLSPGGRFVVYFDRDGKSVMSYDVASGAVRHISGGITTDWRRFDAQWRPQAWANLRGVAGWLRDDAAVLVYDRYDLWLLDPEGARAPVNLTRGYGARHQTIFTVRADAPPRERVFAPDERLILSAFDRVSKHSGFFSQSLKATDDPRRLTMGPHAYHLPTGAGWMPIKAGRAQKYLVRRESATESPNYFATGDFETFTRLSDQHPEKEYNWLRARLLAWEREDGAQAQGVLYTPGDFDPARKYPVIFNYYELVTDDLNAHPSLQALTTGCEINIPAYVSRGYVVVRPDIHYERGKLRDSAVQAVVSAAQHMKGMPWVDGGRMGVQGCSFGGIATNNIVTSTGMFAAAASSSGLVDLIGAYGGLWLPYAKSSSGGASLQGLFETGQLRMGASLWERPDLYRENSAIFHVDDVSTPILLMHTRDDVLCPFSNAVEFFTALRRLGKPAWLLQYNDGNHQLEGRPAEDFSIRMAQFFDHYLRGAPPPRWMIDGVPARLKGIETGLELGAPGEQPGLLRH